MLKIGDEIVVSNCCSRADPEKWDGRDVARCVRWVARTFSVRAPRRHLLPDCGASLLQLTQDHWLQVCYIEIYTAIMHHFIDIVDRLQSVYLSILI